MTERKIRCRIPSRRTSDPCPNEAISDLGWCSRHLAEAHAEFEAITAQAKRSMHEQDQDGTP